MAADNLIVRPGGKRLALALITAVGCAVGAGYVTAVVARASSQAWASDVDKLAPLLIAVVYTTVIAALLLVLGRTPEQRRDWLGLRSTTGRSLGTGLLVWTGAYLAAAVFYMVTTPIGGSLPEAVRLLGSVGADNGRLHNASAGLIALMLVRIMVLSPVGEELLFRGALFTWLRTRLSARWTIVITGVAFGLIHHSPTFLPLAIIVGIAAGWIREKTGSTYVPIAIHMVQNIVVVLLSLAITGWDTPAMLR